MGSAHPGSWYAVPVNPTVCVLLGTGCGGWHGDRPRHIAIRVEMAISTVGDVMNWEHIFACFWEGLAGGIVGCGGALSGVVVAKKGMPADWEWLVAIIAGALGFVNGVRGYKREPK